MPIRGADGSSVQLHGGESGTPRPQDDMVETTSPPSRPVSRPKAPPLNFASPRLEPPKAPESSTASVADSTPTADSVPAATSETAVARDLGREEVSVPPVGLDSAFFEDPPFSPDASLEIDQRHTRAALKRTPGAARRRAHLARYVTVAVTLACALCAAALFKVARGHEEPTPLAFSRGPATATVAPAPDPAAAALDQPPTTESPPSPAQGLNSSPTDTPSQPQPAQAPEAPPGASGPSAPPEQAAGTQAAQAAQAAQGASGDSVQGGGATATGGPSGPVETAEVAAAGGAGAAPAMDAPRDPKEIAKEAANAKVKARSALEWGKPRDAIAAGESSVALDPTDAEAWLILGAAYQEKGDSKNAVRSFQSCLAQGKRGPKNECAAMLR